MQSSQTLQSVGPVTEVIGRHAPLGPMKVLDSYERLNHLLRQIGYDEVIHRDKRVHMMSQPRYS